MTAQPELEEAAAPVDAAAGGAAPPSGASPLRWILRAAAVLLVAGLFGLLVFQIVHRGVGTRLVADVRAGKEPQAPNFRLGVIWPRTEMWPTPLRRIGARGPVSPGDLRGYPVVINFWASWCLPCGEEAPRLVASARAHRGRVAFLGIDVKDFTGDARRFLRRHRVNYPSVHDAGSGIYEDYGLTGVPETYYLDASGRIVAHSPGAVTRAELEANIRRIVDGGS